MNKQRFKKMRKLYRQAQKEYNHGDDTLMETYLILDPNCIAQKFYITKDDLKPYYSAITVEYWARR